MSSQDHLSIVIAHHNSIYITNLHYLLPENQYIIKGTSNSGIVALRDLLTKKPDIAILSYDLSYLNAFDIIKIVIKKKLKTKFIVIFDKNNPSYIPHLQSQKLIPIFCINDTVSEIKKCIKKLTKDSKYI